MPNKVCNDNSNFNNLLKETQIPIQQQNYCKLLII